MIRCNQNAVHRRVKCNEYSHVWLSDEKNKVTSARRDEEDFFDRLVVTTRRDAQSCTDNTHRNLKSGIIEPLKTVRRDGVGKVYKNLFKEYLLIGRLEKKRYADNGCFKRKKIARRIM